MKTLIALIVASVLMVTACSGNSDLPLSLSAAEPTLPSEDSLSSNVRIVNGCRIEPRTTCNGADLSGVNLSSSNLMNADLSGANLEGAILASANLSRANLADTNLMFADLSGANLFNTRFGGSNLSGANLRAVEWLSMSNLGDAQITCALWVDNSRRVPENFESLMPSERETWCREWRQDLP